MALRRLRRRAAADCTDAVVLRVDLLRCRAPAGGDEPSLVGALQPGDIEWLVDESAGVIQLVECQLPKLDVAGSSPVARSPGLVARFQLGKRPF